VSKYSETREGVPPHASTTDSYGNRTRASKDHEIRLPTLERIECVDHGARRIDLDEVLFVEVGVVTPDGRIACDRTRQIEHVVRVGVADRVLCALDSRVELVGWNDLDVLEQEVDELFDTVRF
jgi:hypothetical protein